MKMYNTNGLFDNTLFASILCANGIDAYAVEDGVVFDEKALANVKKCELPHWIYMNLKYMI